MKRLKYILLLLIIIPINTFAIEFYCDRNVKPNSTFSCVIFNSSNSLYNFTANLDYPNEIKLKNITLSKEYTNNSSNNNLNITGPGFNAPSTIGVLTFTTPNVASENKYIISLKNIKFKYLSTESNYHDNEGDLSYSVIINQGATTTTTVTTTSKVSNLLNLKLHFMNNNVQDETLTCEESNGECTIYIADIEIKEKSGYEFVGWSDTSKCETYGKYDLYILTDDKDIYACYKPNTSDTIINYLENITIEDYNINFNKYIFNYNLTVDDNTSKLIINATPINSSAKIEISENINNLIDGINNVTINVIDNNVTTTYLLSVFKNYKENPAMNNLTIDGYNINFNSNIYDYNLVVKYGTKKLNVKPICDENIECLVENNSNENLYNGSKITILVNNNDKSTIYTINIKYESFFITYLYYVYGGAFCVFCLIVYFVVKHLKSDKYKNKKESKKSNLKMVKQEKNIVIEPTKEKITIKDKKRKKSNKNKKEKIEKL